MLCEYGCGQEAKFQTKKGKNICSKYCAQCPALRKKNSFGLSIAHKEGRLSAESIRGKGDWAKGKNRFNDSRISWGKYTPDNVFKEDSEVRNKFTRKVILENNLLEYRCSSCGIGPEWNNRELTLELHHKNGDHKDGKLENLTFLCPNCHSQTKKYRQRKEESPLLA